MQRRGCIGMSIHHINRMNKTRKFKKSWGNSDLKMLVWIIGKYCEKNKIRDVERGIVRYILT